MISVERKFLRGYVDSRLRDLVGQFADEHDAPVSDCVAFLIAGALGCPEFGEGWADRDLTMPRTRYQGKNESEKKIGDKVQLDSNVDARLYAKIVAYAESENENGDRPVPISECVAQLVAKALKRPDLAEVPRKRLGRPREW
jgi:hypothetical protein